MGDTPRFIYIFCDELRADALGCYGGPVPTPHIDALAQRGALFENSFCTSPVCVASRFSILTSRYPEETGVYHNEAAYPAYPVVDGFDTFVNVLKRAGWATASFGKTHLPKTSVPPFAVNDGAGGEMTLGLVAPAAPCNVFKPAGSFKSILAADYPSNLPYGPEQVTEHGLAWLAEQEGPYFARFSFLQPHTPIIVPRGYVERVPEDAFDGVVDNYPTSAFEERFAQVCDIRGMDPADAVRMRRYYQALVLWIDDQVGRIMEAARARGDADDTYVIFHADHGASRGENGFLAKQTFAPQVHRVPLIISGPGIAAGTRESGLCDGLDVGPTVLARVGVPAPSEFRGSDLFASDRVKPYVFATIGYGEVNSRAFPNKAQGTYFDGHGWPRRACVRTDRYRLDMSVRMDGVPIEGGEDAFLCDYIVDPCERINLADDPAYADVLARLRSVLLAHIEGSHEIDDPVVLECPRRR